MAESSREPALSVVLPSYREEQNLRVLLPRLRAVLDGLPEPAEILVVDTPQPLDATADACREHGARHVPRRPGGSYGDAVRTGIAEARGRWILFMDADGSHPPEFIPRMVEASADADVVAASRYVAGGATDNPLALRAMSRILNATYSLVLGLDCRDVSNSFKLYRSEPLRRLRLRCRNFDVIEEILFRLARSNPRLRIREIPFAFKKRMFGETKRNLPLFILTYVGTMVRLRLSALDRR